MTVNPFTEWSKTPAAKMLASWERKIGKIFDLVETPCQNGNALIFIGAAFYALPIALVTLKAFECEDYAYDKAKQLWKAGPRRGGRRHGRGGTPGFRANGRLDKTGGSGSGFTYHGFRIGDFFQSIGAKILIIDTALDFSINWLSMGLEWNGCGPPPPVHGLGLTPGIVIGEEGDIRQLDLIAEPGNVGVAMGIGGFATTIPTFNIHATGTVDTKQFLWTEYKPPASVNWRISGSSSGPLNLNQTSGQNAPSDNQSSAYAKASWHGPTKQLFTGYLEVVEGSSGSGGSIINPTTCSVIGDDKSLNLLKAPGKDPCQPGVIIGRG